MDDLTWVEVGDDGDETELVSVVIEYSDEEDDDESE
jgi:hypothetical protein